MSCIFNLLMSVNFQQQIEAQSLTGENPEFSGKAVVALARDRNVMRKSGKILMTADLAAEYRFTDNNSKF